MKILTRILVLTICSLSFSLSLFSANITILESQSVHPLHKMDNNWKAIAESLGHTANIVDQTFLDAYSNLSATDVLFITSGLIEIPDNRKATILQFIQNGGNVYLQSEYLIDLPGNITFEYLVSNLGGTFAWEEEVAGDLTPMEIVGDLSSNLMDANSIGYYWYGANGSGDDHITPFLKYNNKDWGFIYCSSEMTHGKVITTSDQDWIRTSNNNNLMINILNYLSTNTAPSNLPLVSIIADNSPCDDGYTFTATIDNSLPGLNVQWLINGEVVANENGLSFSSNSLIDGDVVECRIAMSNFCASYEHVSNPILIAPIFPAESPEISITTEDNSFCQGQQATFTAGTTQTTTITNLNFQWLVNGLAVQGANTAVFSTDLLNDQDQVTCQLTYDDDCNAGLIVLSNPIEVSVTPLLTPELVISADVNEICEGDLVTFTAAGNQLGVDPVYQWQVNGINTGTNSPVFSTENIANGQVVTCVATVQNLCSTTNEANSNTISITVNEIVNPGIEITASTTEICQGEMVTFTAIASDYGTNPAYQWQVDGQNVGTNQPVFTTTLENGQLVNCILSVAESCTNSAAITSESISISVNPGLVPTLAITSNNNWFCAGGNATFTASGENHGTNPIYEWFVNGVSVGNDAPMFSIENVQSDQEVSCQLINNEACASNVPVVSNLINLSVSNLVIEILELQNENCGSADGLIEIQAAGGMAPYTFEWSNGATTSMITDIAAESYELLVTDVNGCSFVTTIDLENNAGPQVADIVSVKADCSGKNGSAELFFDNASSIASIEWKDAEGRVVSYDASASDLSPGIYEIAVTNEYGCVTLETVIIEQLATIAVAVNQDQRLDLGAALTLEAITNTTQNVSYEWFPAEGLSCTTCPNPIASPTSTIEYTVVVTNENGCTASEDVIIHVIPKDDLFIPNAFSPNGDGFNDAFTVFAGDNVSQIKTLRVFDRWGAEVFSNQDFSPNLEQEGWNGMYKGKLMNSGVYVYFVEVEYIDGSVKIKKGDLSITL